MLGALSKFLANQMSYYCRGRYDQSSYRIISRYYRSVIRGAL